jgi:hypothetical protein
MNSIKEFFRICHSNLSLDAFIALLQQRLVLQQLLMCDAKRVPRELMPPFSRYLPPFNQSTLKVALSKS